MPVDHVIYKKYPSSRMLTTKRGVRVIVLQSGILGVASFQAFMLCITTALTMLVVVKTLVIMTAGNALANSAYYKSLFLEKSPDFSEIEEQKKRLETLSMPGKICSVICIAICIAIWNPDPVQCVEGACGVSRVRAVCRGCVRCVRCALLLDTLMLSMLSPSVF
jgi:hypothetical protein